MATRKTTSTDADKCAVLTHPAFDRPPVHNEGRRGRKAGTVPLSSARNKRHWAGVDAERQALRMATPPHDVAADLMRSAPDRAGADAAASLTGDDAVIAEALALLDSRLRRPGVVFDSPNKTKQYVTLHLAEREREEFMVLFLTNQHALIAFECFGLGTLTQCQVYPREVARRALALNAAAVILAHNHPSGEPEPSRSDEHLTVSLKTVLSLVGVRVIDHLVVGRLQVVSFAERGWL